MVGKPHPSVPRAVRRQRRSVVELGAVVVTSVVFYLITVEVNAFEWVDQWIDLHRHVQAGELFLALPFGMVLVLIYSWRRYREAQAETAAAVAAERDLHRSTAEFRSLFDYHPQAVYAIDVQGRYRRVNPAAQSLSGYNEEEFTALTFPALQDQGSERGLVQDALARALGGHPEKLETAVVRKDGVRRDVAMTMIPIVVAGEPVGVYVVSEDITEDKQLRGELARALRDAELANEAKTLLLANVSHELRTPLAGVIGAAELLGDTDLRDEQQRMLGMISRNAHSLLRLVEDLLDLTRLDAGRLNIELVPFDVCQLLERAAAEASSKAREKGLAVRVRIDGQVPRLVVGDPLRVAQVLTNLLDNAVKFTHEGEVGIVLECGPRDQRTVEVSFRVWDTGIGIASEDQQRLFEHFVQVDPSSTRRYGGAGLGLGIVKQLVELMDGEVFVESRIGSGSTFTVRIPFGKPEAC